MPPRSEPRAILFDLDGTLLDTAPDFAFALNSVRAEDGLEPLPYDGIRPFVSQGSLALTRLGFEYAQDSKEFVERRQRLLDVYSEHLAEDTRLFAGMSEVLGRIESTGRCWGIVTNKPGWLTTPLLKALGLDERAACVISGDSTRNVKPHPDPLLEAAESLEREEIEVEEIETEVEEIERVQEVVEETQADEQTPTLVEIAEIVLI